MGNAPATGGGPIDANDADSSVLSFLRRGHRDVILMVGNFAPVLRKSCRLGAPEGGWWRELLNSDAGIYGGSNLGNAGGVMAEPVAHHGRPFSLKLTLPPLGILYSNSNGKCRLIVKTRTWSGLGRR